ncbi:response regulator [Defluviimonas aestuarii]|uniref:response regulator transcription factor n=1 Tax=Albidovulum aestuarii TaxID=1130726 RepID=UPI00249B068F|nr:response regulator [Defluviimonas aestuarii]MDI3335101.1 response regulator [Defluviimonas aestuarii]
MGRHVLLIEDEPHIAEAIRFLLDREGWVVTSHSDGADAVEMIKRASPDIVILDLLLPGRSGHEILTDLRVDPAFATLPVLVLSARGSADTRARVEQAGASRFMAKPFANDEIVATLRQMTPA